MSLEFITNFLFWSVPLSICGFDSCKTVPCFYFGLINCTEINGKNTMYKTKGFFKHLTNLAEPLDFSAVDGVPIIHGPLYKPISFYL